MNSREDPPEAGSSRNYFGPGYYGHLITRSTISAAS